MARGRPPSAVKPIVVRVALYLYPGTDDDLIKFFDTLPVNVRSGATKQTLRSGHLQIDVSNLPSDEEIEASLDGLLSF
jgi:hypothetical protein